MSGKPSKILEKSETRPDVIDHCDIPEGSAKNNIRPDETSEILENADTTSNVVVHLGIPDDFAVNEDSPIENDIEDNQLDDECTKEDIKYLQFQFEELSSKVDTIGDNQESVSRSLFALLSKNTREKIEDQTFFFFMQDTYAFIMVDPFSLSALVGWSIFVLQIGCFLLAVSKYFVTSQFSLQKVSFPKGVDKSVSAGQIVTIFLILVVQQALWESMSVFSSGYSDDLRNHGVKRNWWFVSLTLRLIEGLVASFVTFWLVLQSDDILELFKDFTAIAFISSLDNLIFVIANMRVLGSRVNDTIDKCNKFSQHFRRIHTSNTANRKIKSFPSDSVRYLLFHPFVFALILMAVMYGIWAEYVFFPQVNGRYLCQQLYLQLDDDVNFELSYFSGSYKKLEGKDKRGWYPAYREFTSYEAKNNHLEPNMILRFCENLNSWVFTLERENFEEECDQHHALIRSTNVENQQKFDLLEVPEADWFVKDLNEDKWIILDNFVRDCEDQEPKYNLDDSQTCTSLVVDEREELFVGARLWPNKFIMMGKDSKYTKLYNHPVYTNDITNKGQDQELIVFLGKRWAMMTTNDLKDYIDGTDLFSYFRTNFHARWSDYTVAFFSEPVTSDTTKDTMSPVGLKWVMASPKIAGQNQQAEDNREKRSIFLCRECHNETNPCFYEGICLSDKSCQCTNNSTGTLCQVLPTQNGYCNAFFNERDYSYDGGDCCENTCVSNEYKCGRDESGLFYVGYDSCEADICTDCWRPSEPSPNMKDLIVTDMSLSSSGRVLGLIEAVGKTARVYDNDGSRWVMRGSAVMNIYEPTSSIIQVMGHEDVLNDKNSFSPITVAIKTNEKIHVFDWKNTLWSECDGNIFNNVSSLPIQLDFKNNGNSLGVLYENDFKLFERDHSSLSWKGAAFDLNISGQYKYVSLSKNAKKVILANETCAEIHNLLNNIANTKCNLQDSRAIKQIVLSPNGQKLGMLFERGSQGEVVVFHVENNTFFENGNALRGISVETAKIEISNDGATVASYSGMSNVVKIHQYLNNKWQMTDSMSSKSMALSSNQKVMATISPTTGYPAMFHRNVFCEKGFSNVRLSFIADDHPNELMWEILNITESGDINILKNGGPYESAQTMIVEELCVDDNVIHNRDLVNAYCIGLRVVDLGRDGLKSPGKIGISINGTMILTIDETDGYDNIYRVVGNMDCLEFVKEDLPWPDKYNPSLHKECFTFECEWIKIGNVNKSSYNNDDGEFLSMSADGSVVSIGDWRNNQVKVLKYQSNSGWIPHGADSKITGRDDNVKFGWSTSLSADGSIVAIGDPYSNANETWSGQIRLYAFNKTNNSWSQYGNAINGPEESEGNGLQGAKFGTSVSLSADGSVFAAGTWIESRLACAAFVYEFSPITSEWIQKGGCIGDERFHALVIVKLSSTGLGVVLSYPFPNNKRGLVMVYEYNSFDKEWIQLGNDIHGDSYEHFLGASLDISSDGSILAASGHTSFPAQTYKFDEGKNDWRQIGQNIYPSYGACTNSISWYDVCLSSDGSIWVVSYCGIIRVLIYDKTINEWKDSIVSFPTVDFSDFHSITASAADALTLATKGDNSIEIYNLIKNPVSIETCDGTVFDFTIQPDRFPGDISWFLQDQAGDIVFGGNLPNDEIDLKNTFKYNKCLEKNSSTFHFYIGDEYGDGICCDWGKGHFTVKWDDETVMKEDNFKSNKSICLPLSSNLVFMAIHVFKFNRLSALLVLDSNGNTLLSRDGTRDAGDDVMLYQCIPSNECIKIALLNTEKVSVYFNDGFNQTFVPTKALEGFHVGDCNMPSCPQTHSFFEMYLGTDLYPEEFSWDLFDLNNKILMSGGSYRTPNKVYHYQKCVAVSKHDCATIMLRDSAPQVFSGILHEVTWSGKIISTVNPNNGADIEFTMCGVITCPQTQSLLEIFWTKNQDFSYELLDSMNNTVISGGNYDQENETFYFRGCVSVPSDECGTLILYDRSDDTGAIDYRVVWNGDEMEIPILVGSVDKINVGNCTIEDVCPENYSLFHMLIRTDAYPEDFLWELLNSNNTILYNDKDYADKNTEYHHRGCIAVSQNECATLKFYDSYGDGGTYYDVTWNGDTTANGTGTLENEYKNVKMGSCDENN